MRRDFVQRELARTSKRSILGAVIEDADGLRDSRRVTSRRDLRAIDRDNAMRLVPVLKAYASVPRTAQKKDPNRVLLHLLREGFLTVIVI
jgi:hypothetical protein